MKRFILMLTVLLLTLPSYRLLNADAFLEPGQARINIGVRSPQDLSE